MTKRLTNNRVDEFFTKAKKWKAEMNALRTIVLDSGLTEELKWYQPCYTFDGSNVIIISAFKEFCVLSFFKGALLKDAKGLLDKPGENTQSGRWIKFTSVQEIEKLKPVLKTYVREAIEVEKAGLKVKYKKTSEYKIPEELQIKLDESPALKTAFNNLTPGRQRGYLLYFSAAKQSKTRTSRIEKCTKQILIGKGLND